MEQKFNEIKEAYDNYHKEMLVQGKLPLRDTGVGFWGGAVTHEVFETFKRIGLNNFSTFLDLGSGDGRVVLIASLFGVRATGVEIDDELYMKSVEMQNNLEIPNAIFYNDDFHEHNVAGYDFIFINPDQPIQKVLEQKLINEMSGKLIVYGHHFHPKSLNRENEMIINGTLVTVYGKE